MKFLKKCAHCAHFLLDKRARRVYTPIIKMARIGKKPIFPRAERDAFAVSILRKRPAVPPLSRPRNKRDGIARYSGHKRRKMRKQGGTVEYLNASPLRTSGVELFCTLK